jgi:hypothetical protein
MCVLAAVVSTYAMKLYRVGAGKIKLSGFAAGIHAMASPIGAWQVGTILVF